MKIVQKYLSLGVLVFIAGCQPKTELEFSASSLADSLGSNAKYSLNLQVTDRRYTATVLRKVFNIQNGTASEKWIETNIYAKSEFGGGCDPYAESDLGADLIEFPSESCGRFDTVLRATSNPMRYGLTMKTCEYLTDQAENMNEIKLKIFGSRSWAIPTDSTVEKAWALFYPADGVDADTTAALKDLHAVAKDTADAWKLILFTLCSSPGWQSF